MSITRATVSAVTPRVVPWRRIALAAALVAVLDGIFAYLLYVPITGDFTFVTLQQFIASGFFGPAAFASGAAGVGYVLFGMATHVAISVAVTVVYALAVAPRVRTRAAAVVVGLVYGAVFWLVMNAIVLPLGRSGQEPFLSANYVAFLIEHAVLVGLPIALVLFGARQPREDG